MNTPIDSMKLLHYSAKPFEFDPSKRYKDNREFDHKPTGLWLSVEGEHDWPAWCTAENFGLERMKHASEVTLKPSARVLVIDSIEKLDAFTTLYGAPDVDDIRFEIRAIDWPRVKRVHDGLIIAPYQWERRLDLMWYYTWDCASGVIWNMGAIAEVQNASVIERNDRGD